MLDEFPIDTLLPADFPAKLREIPDAPARLFVRGRLPGPATKILCVVGSRKHTAYGADACKALIAGLAGHDIAIVSGLALGIDAVAHRAAIDAGLATVAVPGSGLDPSVLYPATNRPLADEILRAGGALVSAFDPDFRATAWSFPERNRIMAGLADAVLVVEAETKSGTLITARLAADYNRDVLAVPGSIFSRNADGPHMLMRLGAAPVRSSADILDAFGFAPDEAPKNRELKYAGCTSEELLVVAILAEPLPKDELVRRLGLPVSKASAVISVMEIKGLIAETMGEMRLV